MALQVQIIPAGILLSGVAFQEGGIISVRDEADILAVPLPGIDKALLLGDLPHLLLGQLSQGELGVGQLLLIQAGQKVGLILGLVHGFI